MNALSFQTAGLISIVARQLILWKKIIEKSVVTEQFSSELLKMVLIMVKDDTLWSKGLSSERYAQLGSKPMA